jgi:hypothetical protein
MEVNCHLNAPNTLPSDRPTRRLSLKSQPGRSGRQKFLARFRNRTTIPRSSSRQPGKYLTTWMSADSQFVLRNVLYFRCYSTPTNPWWLNNNQWPKMLPVVLQTSFPCSHVVSFALTFYIIYNYTYSRKIVTWCNYKHNSKYVVA